MTAELDELKWKLGAGVWYTARDDEDDPPLKKNDGCRRVAKTCTRSRRPDVNHGSGCMYN